MKSWSVKCDGCLEQEVFDLAGKRLGPFVLLSRYVSAFPACSKSLGECVINADGKDGQKFEECK